MKTRISLLTVAALAASAQAQVPRVTCELSHVFLPSNSPLLMNLGDYAQLSLSVSVSPPIGAQVGLPFPPGVGTVAGMGFLDFDLIACDRILGPWTVQGEGYQGTTGTTWGIRNGWLGFEGTPQATCDLLNCSVGQFPLAAPNALNPVTEIWRGKYGPYSPGTSAMRRMRFTLYPRSASIFVRYIVNGTPQYATVAAAVDPVSVDLGSSTGGPPPPCWAEVSVWSSPESLAVPSGSPASFHVTGEWWSPTPSCPAFTYRWRRDCQPLTDGGRISGATTDTLHIDAVTFTDHGMYDAVVSGVAQSRAALLTVLCFANCDGSTSPPVLNIADFSCFVNRFAAGDTRANCDASTTAPILNALDFSCFLNQFAAGCP